MRREEYVMMTTASVNARSLEDWQIRSNRRDQKQTTIERDQWSSTGSTESSANDMQKESLMDISKLFR